ncbi:MAG: right-handed parallel beta-helix repeat-containing protein, partial [Bacteroidota bacterium]|nr:right-handed parallel beta-helix repeat-containing protein [Bacteroidota bacterium]
NLTFEGLTFSFTSWMRPSTQGHVPLQAGMYLLDAYRLKPKGTPGNPNKGLDNQAWIGRPPAAVQLNGVCQTTFAGCRFEHLGSCGIDYGKGTKEDTIRGCLFTDIAGNGIQAGQFSDPGVETHLPYNPADERELCCQLTIQDNYITNVTNEDWGCTGIAAGYVRGINIAHNEISEVSYTGISLGWGWTKTSNCMRDNRVFANYVYHYAKHLYDVGGIYTLSVQPGTVLSENVIDSIYKPAYVHDSNHWFYLYTDEGSSYITVRDNWCPAAKFLANANGPGNNWENNGPMVADSIRLKAGLEPAYKYLKSLTCLQYQLLKLEKQ